MDEEAGSYSYNNLMGNHLLPKVRLSRKFELFNEPDVQDQLFKEGSFTDFDQEKIMSGQTTNKVSFKNRETSPYNVSGSKTSPMGMTGSKVVHSSMSTDVYSNHSVGPHLFNVQSSEEEKTSGDYNKLNIHKFDETLVQTSGDVSVVMRISTNEILACMFLNMLQGLSHHIK